ncbi:MAG: cysteine-rich CWC family protein [Paludibacteraceae bacterium]|nr:cysteine-rich CWC family protein [Paludibacteraceae bacterium]
MEKRCPRCGAAFVCTHDAYCQCVGVKLDEKARAYLRTHYEDCLCRKCLINLSLTLPSREGIEESEESESV